MVSLLFPFLLYSLLPLIFPPEVTLSVSKSQLPNTPSDTTSSLAALLKFGTPSPHLLSYPPPPSHLNLTSNTTISPNFSSTTVRQPNLPLSLFYPSVSFLIFFFSFLFFFSLLFFPSSSLFFFLILINQFFHILSLQLYLAQHKRFVLLMPFDILLILFILALHLFQCDQ